MHYFGADANDDDQEEDMKLPFKKISTQTHLSPAIPVIKYTLLKQHSFAIPAKPERFGDYRIVNTALGALFRPPRV